MDWKYSLQDVIIKQAVQQSFIAVNRLEKNAQIQYGDDDFVGTNSFDGSNNPNDPNIFLNSVRESAFATKNALELIIPIIKKKQVLHQQVVADFLKFKRVLNEADVAFRRSPGNTGQSIVPILDWSKNFFSKVDVSKAQPSQVVQFLEELLKILPQSPTIKDESSKRKDLSKKTHESRKAKKKQINPKIEPLFASINGRFYKNAKNSSIWSWKIK